MFGARGGLKGLKTDRSLQQVKSSTQRGLGCRPRLKSDLDVLLQRAFRVGKQRFRKEKWILSPRRPCAPLVCIIFHVLSQSFSPHTFFSARDSGRWSEVGDCFQGYPGFPLRREKATSDGEDPWRSFEPITSLQVMTLEASRARIHDGCQCGDAAAVCTRCSRE